MVTFSISIIILILGYLVYGKYVEKTFAPDANRTTPATTMRDNVDYIPMATWKVYLIQFLNMSLVLSSMFSKAIL